MTNSKLPSGDPSSHLGPPTVPVSEFKSQCLAMLKELDREGLIVTQRGEPVALVIPYPAAPASLIGCMRGELEIRGDLLSTGIRWESDAEP